MINKIKHFETEIDALDPLRAAITGFEFSQSHEHVFERGLKDGVKLLGAFGLVFTDDDYENASTTRFVASSDFHKGPSPATEKLVDACRDLKESAQNRRVPKPVQEFTEAFIDHESDSTKTTPYDKIIGGLALLQSFGSPLEQPNYRTAVFASGGLLINMRNAIYNQVIDYRNQWSRCSTDLKTVGEHFSYNSHSLSQKGITNAMTDFIAEQLPTEPELRLASGLGAVASQNAQIAEPGFEQAEDSKILRIV